MPKAEDRDITEADVSRTRFDADVGLNKLCDIKWLAEGLIFMVEGMGLDRPHVCVITTIADKIRQDAQVALDEFTVAAKLARPGRIRVPISGTTDD